MDDKTFLREKVRRELQEALTAADEATVAAAEGDEEAAHRKDTELAVKLIALNLNMKEVGEALLGVSRKEDNG